MTRVTDADLVTMAMKQTKTLKIINLYFGMLENSWYTIAIYN